MNTFILMELIASVAPQTRYEMSFRDCITSAIAERITVGKMFNSFERDLEDFEALKVCVG